MSSARILSLEAVANQSNSDFNVLDRFFLEKDECKVPKKDYMRCKMIRGHKRATRQLLKGIIPKKTYLHRFDIDDMRSLKIWLEIKSIVEKNLQVFTKISKTISGPKTGKNSEAESIEKSFNLSFCFNYFSDENIRLSYYYYIQLIFSNFDLNVLCDKFQFKCCLKNRHNIECIQS